MKTILEYLVNNHISNYDIGSNGIYPKKIQSFMDDINKFINETIVPLGVHEEDNIVEVKNKNKDGWYLLGYVFRKWFDDYDSDWITLGNLIKKPIKEIAAKHNLICKFDRFNSIKKFSGKVILYKKNTTQDNYCFMLELYCEYGTTKIFCAVNKKGF